MHAEALLENTVTKSKCPVKFGRDVSLSPVLPLLRAANEVLRDLLDVLHVSAAVGVEQGQPGLDEGAGDLVQAAPLVFAGRLVAVQLRLGQDEVHQADELVGREPQHKLLCFLLRAPQKQERSTRERNLTGGAAMAETLIHT